MNEFEKPSHPMRAAWSANRNYDVEAMGAALDGDGTALAAVRRKAFFDGWKAAEKHRATPNAEPTLLGADEDGLIVRVNTPNMSLRDHFANQALAPTLVAMGGRVFVTRDEALNRIAQTAYDVADAMLGARAKTEGDQ
jgi:hypothetical protein